MIVYDAQFLDIFLEIGMNLLIDIINDPLDDLELLTRGLVYEIR